MVIESPLVVARSRPGHFVMVRTGDGEPLLARAMAPLRYETATGRMERIHGLGLNILLVEQNATAAFRDSSRAYVLEHGRSVLEGRSDKLAGQDDVRRAYLGV
jgi:ABC-type branched-subunit amino acid transport system ATPase component